MGKGCRTYEVHDFYCINCGQKGLPLRRAKDKGHNKHHRKLLYCINCRHTVNHIECRTLEEVEEFKTNFQNGVYEQEAKEELQYELQHKNLSALCHGRSSGIR